jgi:hypothetical protein
MRALLLAIVAPVVVLVAACAPLVGEDFDGYVGRPTTCDLLAPTTANPRQHVVCSEGQTCAAATPDGTHSVTARSCFTASDSRAPLEACEVTTDCAAGSFCAGVLGCIAYCRLDVPICAGSGPCVAFSDGPEANGAEALGFCGSPACNPLGGDCNGACIFYDIGHAGCFPRAGVAKRGAVCKSDTDCVGGLACGKEGFCTPYCRMTAGANDCGGPACEAVDGEELVIDGVRFGYCASIRSR